MTTGYRNLDLFGGAIVAQIPIDYLDVSYLALFAGTGVIVPEDAATQACTYTDITNSDIRQVPDHQEVFLSRSGFSSLTIDICDRVTDQPDDVSALQYHFDDLIDEEDTKFIQTKKEDVKLPHFTGTSVLSLAAKVVSPGALELRRRDPKVPTFTIILFALIRLERQMTDLEVILNLPNIPGSQDLAQDGQEVDLAQEQYGSVVREGIDVFNEVLQSLEVKDLGLFGPGG